MGALARVTLETGKSTASNELLRSAEKSFTTLEDAGRVLKEPQIVVAALMGNAEAVRFQDRLEDADHLLRAAVAEAAKASMAKLEADGLYTLALVQEERNLIADALNTLHGARALYQKIGDIASAEDAKDQLNRMSTAPAPLVAKQKPISPPLELAEWPTILDRLARADNMLPLAGTSRGVADLLLDKFEQSRDRVSATTIELGFPPEDESLSVANRLVEDGYVRTEAVIYFWPAVEFVAGRAAKFKNELSMLDALLRHARTIYETPDAVRRLSIVSYLARLESESQRSVFRLLCFSLDPFLVTATGSSVTNTELEIRPPIRTINGIAECVEARAHQHAGRTKDPPVTTGRDEDNNREPSSVAPAAEEIASSDSPHELPRLNVVYGKRLGVGALELSGRQRRHFLNAR
jgi:hypothetical protein